MIEKIFMMVVVLIFSNIILIDLRHKSIAIEKGLK